MLFLLLFLVSLLHDIVVEQCGPAAGVHYERREQPQQSQPTCEEGEGGGLISSAVENVDLEYRV